jgi:F-type H+-transporting ATPase subunit b
MAIISSAFAAEEAEQATEGVADSHAGSLAEGGAHHEGGFPPFEKENFAPQLIWLALIFGLLYVLMSRVALPRVGKIIGDRETRISADLDASREMQAKAQAAAAANDETLRVRREEAQAIGREAQQKISQQIAAQRAAAEKEAAEKMRAAEERIAAAKAEALANIGDTATEAAAEILRKLTGASIETASLRSELNAIKPS